MDRANAEVAKLLALPDVRERLKQNGVDPAPTSRAELGALIRADAERWGRTVKSIGIKAE